MQIPPTSVRLDESTYFEHVQTYSFDSKLVIWDLGNSPMCAFSVNNILSIEWRESGCCAAVSGVPPSGVLKTHWRCARVFTFSASYARRGCC
jgi:hypothetical protein